MKKMTVGKRILLGFTSMLVLLVLVATASYIGLETAADGFTQYREMARDTNLVGGLQANMLMVRMNVKDFVITGNDAEQKEFDAYFEATSKFLEDSKREIAAPERAEKIRNVESQLKKYQTGFDQVVELMRRRDEAVNGVLNVKGPQMEKDLSEIMQSAQGDDDANAAYNAGVTLKHLLLARLYTAKFLETNEKSAVDRVRQEFEKMQRQLAILDRELQNSERRKLMRDVADTRTTYLKTFDDLVGTIQERNQIIKGTLDVIGPQIAKDVDAVKLDIKSVQDELGPALVKSNDRTGLLIIVGGAVSLLVAIGLTYWVTTSITRPVTRIVSILTNGATQVTSASTQVSQSSQEMAEGANEQASSLEEISSSLEEMSSMTQQNASNVREASSQTRGVQDSATSGSDAMERMQGAIAKIKSSSDETAKIIKTIDEIAFQTNLLALNAAVEAARAGEAGKGFAVVAEEVRNLAQRSAEAARSTSALIEESQRNADSGVSVTKEAAQSFREIVEGITSVNRLISEVTTASDEQARGIEQVNTGVAQMNQVTQANAANAEESASASEELSAQASELEDVVQNLGALVGLSGGNSAASQPARGEKTRIESHATFRTPTKHAAPKLNGNSNGKMREPEKLNGRSAEAMIPLTDDDLVDF